MKLTHKHTLAASYLGYITQAVVNNLTPLLFVVFETSLGISIGRISLLITVNFGVQMLVDLLSAKWINVIGTRRAIVAAHAFAAAGLVALGVLPYRTADPYVGVLCAVCLCAVGGGITEVLISPIVEALPSEDKAGSMSLLHAFYCWGHVGVVVLFRIKQGTIRRGQTVRMMATGAQYTILECGYLKPLGNEPTDALQAGEVGYFTASIKNVKDTQVGDTITDAENPAAEPLPGYRPAQSMVYCGIYTEDGSKYPDLRDALEKLQLNDASLTFEPESSVALGFGFRCGFLGMLHMEIIQERLEREFNLDLVTTLPSVIYHVYKSDGTMVKVDNPHNYPDPTVIEHAEEPYVKVSIISPNEYVGNIMPMCQDRRGEFKDMQYLDTHLVELHYQMPLNEIIYDFFDTLKANTKGYASLDYELSGYRPSELVKVDLLLNGDGVDALSFIAHKDKAYPRARRLCEKLKENIPRQLFEVPIQAAIGGRIIARETVKAMRKDVLAKCYGGDITRKKKLLEKQKEGKKKMRNLGTVQVPTEAFMAVLKLDSD